MTVNELQCWTAREFLNRDFEIEGSEYITQGGLLPRGGKAIVGGISKVGKSLLVMDWALSLSSGRPFLLQFSIPQPYRVVLLQGEISEASMHRRLNQMLNGQDINNTLDNLYLMNEKNLKLDKPRDLRILSEALSKIKPDVFILDPLYKFHIGDENRVSDMMRFFDNFDSLLSEHDMAGIIVHHFGKPSEVKKEGAQQLRGSSSIFDWGDSYLILNRMQGRDSKGYLKVSFELRNDEDPAPLYIHRDPETLRHEVLDEESESKLSITQTIKTLRAMGGRTKKSELIKRLENDSGLSGRRVRDIIDRAIKIGRIHEKANLAFGRASQTEVWIDAN